MANSKANTSESILSLQIGGNGTELLTGVTVYTDKRYQFLYVQEDATFTTLEDSADVDLKTDLLISTNTCIAGSVIRAKNGKHIKNVTLSGGSIWGIL